MFVFRYFRKYLGIFLVLAAVSEGFSSAGSFTLHLIPDLEQNTVTVFFLIPKAPLIAEGINPFFADIFLKNNKLRLCTLEGIIEEPNVAEQNYRPVDPSETAVLSFHCSSDYFSQHQKEILSLADTPLKTKKIQPVNENELLETLWFWPEREKADSLLREANRERASLYHLGVDAYVTIYIVGGVNPLDLSIAPEKAKQKEWMTLLPPGVKRWQNGSNRVLSLLLGHVTPNRLTELAWLSDALTDFFHSSQAFTNVRILTSWNGFCRVKVSFQADDFYPAFSTELAAFLQNRLNDAHQWKHWYQTRYVPRMDMSYSNVFARNLYSVLSDMYLGSATRYFQLYVPEKLPYPAFQQELSILIGQLNE